MALTTTDIDILLEAMDAWVEKDAAGTLMTDLLGGLLAGKDPEAQEAMRLERENARRERDYERAQRKEVATLLKATLIRMKRELMAREAVGI